MYYMSQSYNRSQPEPFHPRPSHLESMVESYTPLKADNPFYSVVAERPQTYSTPFTILPQSQIFNYASEINYAKNVLTYAIMPHVQINYDFQPTDFLKPGRGGQFVGQAEEIKEHVEEAFFQLFHQNFPDDIKISVLEEKRFRKLTPHPNTVGLSLNRRKQGLMSEIFVRAGSIGEVMLTIGHELGHVLTQTLENPHDEEAKAFAFSRMWMENIQENNIANLGEAIILDHPAQNGLHNVAFEFVEHLRKMGKSALMIYQELIKKMISLSTNI